MKATTPLLIPLSFFAAAAACAADPAPTRADFPAPPPPPPHHQHGDMKGPPPFDLSLCQGKAPGSAIEVRMPDGRTVRGSCQLVFLPEMPGQAPALGKTPATGDKRP